MNKDILGGFKGDDNVKIVSGLSNISGGKYSANEIMKLRYRNSWPTWSVGEGRGWYVPRSVTGSGSTNFTDSLADTTHVFVIAAGGAGSGAADNDCQGQGPGGNGGFGQALVSLSSVGSNTANFNIGNGGNSVSGNDAEGQAGNATNITIGNFSITANGGGGGRSKNGGGAQGTSGNCNFSNALLSSTSSVFYSPLIHILTNPAEVTYQNVQTSVNGGGGGCGGSSGSGQAGFVYMRWGNGINANTTLTPSTDYPGSGNTHPYTASY